jgi:hypothetical protein
MTRIPPSVLARWACYIAALAVCAAISYVTDDHMAWFVTGMLAVALAIALPLLAWSYLRRRGDEGLRGF